MQVLDDICLDFMLIIGLESSADKLGVGIVSSEGEVLANQRATYKPPRGSGVLPREASEHHARNIGSLVRKALKEANVSSKDIDLVAFTRGCGMGPCLRVAAVAARTLSSAWDKPLIGVNHQIAHVEIGRLTTGLNDPVVLYVSGGNTQIIAFAEGRYRVFGETLDIPIGNCLDVFGREAGLSDKDAPMGRVVELLAEKTDEYVPLPYVVKGMDLSFSGILTQTKKLLAKGIPKEILANSLQETVFAMLTEVTERALSHTRKEEILITGGVAANARLKQMLSDMAAEHSARFESVPLSLAIDNGAMIAWAGYLMWSTGQRMKPQDLLVDQHFRIEDVEVTWRPIAPHQINS